MSGKKQHIYPLGEHHVTKKRWTNRRTIVALVAIVVLALALGLGLGLGLKHRSSSTELLNTKPSESWRRNPEEYVLSNNFTTSAGNATIRSFTLNLTEKADGAPDGVVRKLLLINDQFPGPVIEANEGDRLVVQVNNFMSIPSAIHWHGQYQNGTTLSTFLI
jgi:FtsP/CotA-like multicopper oxidase with cupredoxin domain